VGPDSAGRAREEGSDRALIVALCVHREVRIEGAHALSQAADSSQPAATVEADDALKAWEGLYQRRELVLRRPREPGAWEGASEGVIEGQGADDVS